MSVIEDRREAYYYERIREAGPKYEGFDLLSTETAVNLLYTSDVFNQVLWRYLAEYGLSRSTFNVLMLLRHGPTQGMQLHDIGELLLVSKANITGLINHLEQKGYVKRVIDRKDRRARLATITSKGSALLDEFVPLHYRNIKRLFQHVTDQEKQTLLRLLRKTRASLMAHSEELHSESVMCQTVRE